MWNIIFQRPLSIFSKRRRGLLVALCLLLAWSGGPGYGRTRADSGQDELFMALKADKVHMRVGPGTIYPILWTYTARNLPLRVLERHGQWLKVEDMAGESGWMYARLLHDAPHLLIRRDMAPLHYHPRASSPVLARLARHVIVKPLTCRVRWCHVRTSGRESSPLEGWIAKADAWGWSGPHPAARP